MRKAIFLLLTSVILLGCNSSSTTTTSLNNKTPVKDSTVVKENTIVNSIKKETLEDKLKASLADPNISSYLKKVYNQKQLVLANDSLMLTIPDSLGSKSKNQLFYFLTFTYSMHGSDGFYSEAIGLASLEYVKNQTEQFCHNFNTIPQLSDKHLENWASCISGEISIANENNEEEAISKLEKQLMANLVGKRKDYKPVISNLITKIKQPITHK